LGKILPEACGSVEIFSQNPKGTDLYCPKRWSVLAALSLLDFLFFASKYYTQKVLVVFGFLEFVLNPFGKGNHSLSNQKNLFYWG
jgi:hypothetical protein